MSVRNAILGLLAQKPRHGYELRAAFEAVVGGGVNWDVKPAQIYTTLERLGALAPAFEMVGMMGFDAVALDRLTHQRFLGIRHAHLSHQRMRRLMTSRRKKECYVPDKTEDQEFGCQIGHRDCSLAAAPRLERQPSESKVTRLSCRHSRDNRIG